MAKILVYYHEGYSHHDGEIIPSKRMATLEAIEAIRKVDSTVRPLMETAKEVEASDLDDKGFYRKKAIEIAHD